MITVKEIERILRNHPQIKTTFNDPYRKNLAYRNIAEQIWAAIDDKPKKEKIIYVEVSEDDWDGGIGFGRGSGGW